MFCKIKIERKTTQPNKVWYFSYAQSSLQIGEAASNQMEKFEYLCVAQTKEMTKKLDIFTISTNECSNANTIVHYQWIWNKNCNKSTD